jgi:hypothetical protein
MVSQYLGKKSVYDYPVLMKRTESRDLMYTISMANSAVFFDTGMNNRDIDLRNI